MRIVRRSIRHQARLQRVHARSAMAVEPVSGLRATDLHRRRMRRMFERPAAVQCHDRCLLLCIPDRQAYPFLEISGPPGTGRMVCRDDPCPARTCQPWRRHPLATASPDCIAARHRSAARAWLQPGAGNRPGDQCAHRYPAASPRTLSCPRDPAAGGAAVDRAGDKLMEAAGVLKAAGAASVENWVVARTLPPAAG